MLPFWRFFIEKRQFTILIMVGLFLWGFFAVLKITKESAPEVQIPVGVVSIALPGASAEDVERLVTNKMEEHLTNLQNLSKLTSVSREGFATIVAEFNASADLDKSIQKLKDEVDKAKIDLPAEAKQPAVSDVNFVDQPVQIISVTTDLPYAKLAELGDRLKTELQTVKGVSRVEVSGVRNREIDVVVRKEDLARYGLSLTLYIFKVHGQDVTTATEGVRAKLEELKKSTLAGSTVLITNDAGEEVRKSLTELTRTGFETMLLVMLALFATIGWRESIVAGLSIPFSFLIAFIGLWYSGNTLNFVSLFSLILAIGILVDSGIVVVEAIHTRVRIFHDKKKAALEALREYSWPLIGGTMTTVAVFFPLFFISGIVGKFISSIPFTIIFVLLASIFVALGLVPTL